jgi:hypothetical protein
MDVTFPPGISAGATPHDRVNRWWNSNNMRWREGKPQPIGGNNQVFANSTVITSPVRTLQTLRAQNNITYLGIGCEESIYVSDGFNVYNITPNGYQGYSSTALNGYGIGEYGVGAYGVTSNSASTALSEAQITTLAPYGEDLIVVGSSDGVPYIWMANTPMSQAVTIIGVNGSTVPNGVTSAFVTNERSLVCLGGGENIPSDLGGPFTDNRYVMWSNWGTYNDFNFANVVTTSGFNPLNTAGELRRGIVVQNGYLIFSDSDVFYMYLTGSTNGAYGFEPIASNITLLSPNTIVTVGGMAFWMTKSGFYQYRGGSVGALPCNISWIFETLDPVYAHLNSNAYLNGQFPEIWFSLVQTGYVNPNITLIYNYVENTWAVLYFGRTAGQSAGCYEYPLMSSIVYNAISNTTNYLILQHDVQNYWLDNGNSRIGNVYLETATLIDGGVGGQQGQQLCTRLQLDSGYGYANSAVYLITSFTNDGVETYNGPYIPSNTGITSTRAGGSNIRLKVYNTQDNDWSFGRAKIETKTVGNR